ncbi:MAG: tyrosine-type recombinase/integrase [Proteobacteria bacterium]|nr:tyrosine-type recombinase/integrase [Pseudomonadota bacterium]
MGVRAEIFFDYIEPYMEYRKVVYETSSQTLKSNLIDLNLFKKFTHKNSLKVIDGPAAIDFQFYLKKERENCGASINRKLFSLRAYSDFLKANDVDNAQSLPFYNLMKIKGGYKNRAGALTVCQIKEFFKKIDRDTILGIRDYCVYGIMYQLGLRVGEIYSLNLDDIDFDVSILKVLGKGNKFRTLHLTNEIKEILAEWLVVRSNFLNSNIHTALFISKKGNRLAIRTMEDNFKKLIARTCFKTHFNITCHTLRHSFASHLNDHGVDILVLQSLMGHSTPRSTTPYIHPSDQKVREAMEKLPTVIKMNELIESGFFKLQFQKIRKKLNH